MIKVFIIDDHSVVRRGLIQILSDEIDIMVIGEASETANITEKNDIDNCDVLILDITMPGKNGLDSLIEFKNKYPQIKILMLSMHSEEEFVIRALNTGADGYLNKDSAPEELVNAIREIHKGNRYIGSTISSHKYLEDVNIAANEVYEKLSKREFQVFCLLASGNSLFQIAEELSINIKTVSTYRTRIMEKFGFSTNMELVHCALKHKLILPL